MFISAAPLMSASMPLPPRRYADAAAIERATLAAPRSAPCRYDAGVFVFHAPLYAPLIYYCRAIAAVTPSAMMPRYVYAHAAIDMLSLKIYDDALRRYGLPR